VQPSGIFKLRALRLAAAFLVCRQRLSGGSDPLSARIGRGLKQCAEIVQCFFSEQFFPRATPRRKSKKSMLSAVTF
jgi:hypothetical protein